MATGPSGLTVAAAGNLYNTTESGGAHDAGTVFQFTPAGQLITLYAFTGGPNGKFPQAGVIRDPAGNLYGTTSAGGIANSQCFNQRCGVVFMLQPTTAGTWKETVLHTFNGADGSQPSGPLLLDRSQSALYGTASTGGDFSCTTTAGGSSWGVVFKITR